MGIWANTIVNTVGAPGGTITASGGAGGNGGNGEALGNCGGGGTGSGGGGGFVYIVTRSYTGLPPVATGGACGPTFGAKSGTGLDGAYGAVGSAGVVLKYNLSTGVWS